MNYSPSPDTSYACANFGNLVNYPENGCAGTIGPGTYLFIVHYYEGPTTWMDDLGRSGYTWDYRMIVLTKPTGYKMFRTCNTQDVYLDTNNPTFVSATAIATFYANCGGPNGACTAASNVNGIQSVAGDGTHIYIMELK